MSGKKEVIEIVYCGKAKINNKIAADLVGECLKASGKAYNLKHFSSLEIMASYLKNENSSALGVIGFYQNGGIMSSGVRVISDFNLFIEGAFRMEMKSIWNMLFDSRDFKDYFIVSSGHNFSQEFKPADKEGWETLLIAQNISVLDIIEFDNTISKKIGYHADFEAREGHLYMIAKCHSFYLKDFLAEVKQEKKEIGLKILGTYKLKKREEIKMKIAYFGDKRDGYGTFTHIASFKIGDENDERIGISSFPDLVEAVIAGGVDKAVIPTENFSVGGVNPSTDSIIHANGNFKIIGKILVPIRHNLIATNPVSLSCVKKVLSFSQATPQCAKWLEKNLPWAEIDNSAVSTAAAVKSLENYGEETAAIGSLMSAEHYPGRIVLAKDIHDHPDNATSFFVLSRGGEKSPTGNDETTLIFVIPDKPGEYYRALGLLIMPSWWRRFFLREKPINSSRVESRPARTKFGEYIFFATIYGHKKDPRVKRALTKLGKRADFVKVLGSYPKVN